MVIRQLTSFRTLDSILSFKKPIDSSQYLKQWLRFSTKLAAPNVKLKQPKAIFVKRPPVVTIMGHVDHGKTTLLDYLRNSQIVKQEFGGITQHIGAFVVPFERPNAKQAELLTFLDTPGHAAFASMRQRGANITDIIVLVVACEDGVLNQTVESIEYAKASDVPIIVAVNKIDKYPNNKELLNNIEILKRQLICYDVKAEEDGGDVQLVKISALKGTGVEELKEAILALSETLNLQVRIDCNVSGRVIESSMDIARGKICTILVQMGELRKGHYLVAGYNWAKVRCLYDEHGQLKQTCRPGFPIQVTGWREPEIPAAGDIIVQVASEAEARARVCKLNEERVRERAAIDAKAAKVKQIEHHKEYTSLRMANIEIGAKYRSIYNDRLNDRSKKSSDVEEAKVNLILKCDVDGSLEALLELLDTYNENNKQPVILDIMHSGVGPITRNDLVLASSFSDSIIYGFNVKLSDKNLILDAKRQGVDLKLFNVIYHLIDDLKSRISERIPDVEQEFEIGIAYVLQEFVVRLAGGKKTPVAGCRCSRGLLKKDVLYRLVRNSEVLAEGLQVDSLKQLKDDVKEIVKDQECGISFLDQTDLRFQPGDQIIAYELRKHKPKLKWNLKGFQ